MEVRGSIGLALLLLLLPAHSHAGRRRSAIVEESDDGNDDGLPPRSWSAGKRREIALATEAEARERQRRIDKGQPVLPIFPTHTTTCGGRVCRPGAGNMKGYKMWFQPYEHREAYVQAKPRRAPHQPDAAHYAGLVAAAKPIAERAGGMVIVTAGDFDYRELVLNWHAHARRLGYQNTLILSMDAELHQHLMGRGVASFDNSANLAAWNHSCLQRHIQAVRTERHIAVAALVASGIDVLLTDATVVFLRDFLPELRSSPAEIDVLLQRDDWPSEPVRRMGTAVNAGFVYLRSANGEDVVRLIMDAVARGLIGKQR